MYNILVPFVPFHRLILPNKISIDLHQIFGPDQYRHIIPLVDYITPLLDLPLTEKAKKLTKVFIPSGGTIV